MPAGIEQEIAALKPLRTNFNHSTFQMALKGDEAGILEMVARLARRARVRHVEVNGASLEDVFVELTKG